VAEDSAITVHRTSPADMQERELYVSVDGAPNVILSDGDTVTIPLTPGHHRLRVHNTTHAYHAFTCSPF